MQRTSKESIKTLSTLCLVFTLGKLKEEKLKKNNREVNLRRIRKLITNCDYYPVFVNSVCAIVFYVQKGVQLPHQTPRILKSYFSFLLSSSSTPGGRNAL